MGLRGRPRRQCQLGRQPSPVGLDKPRPLRAKTARRVCLASSGVEKLCRRHTVSRAADSKKRSVALEAVGAAAAKVVAAVAARGGGSWSSDASRGSSRSNINSTSSSGGQMLVHNNLALGPNSLSEMDLIKSASRAHSWHWNNFDRSHECVVSDDGLEVCFHPQCSESAAAIRGSEPLIRNGNYYYWELTALDKTYGTSVMFGLCTKEQRLHANDYCNLIGLDKDGWSLSHKGLIWHDGLLSPYTKAFPPNRTITVGLLFNTMRGELSYFLDGKNLGVAFYGLHNVDSELYPVIGSTAKCTRIRLTGAYCGYVSLLERSCFTLIKNARDRNELIENLQQLRVPNNLIKYLEEVCCSQTEITAQPDQYNWNVKNNRALTSIRDC